jgi:hypothetical protein
MKSKKVRVMIDIQADNPRDLALEIKSIARSIMHGVIGGARKGSACGAWSIVPPQSMKERNRIREVRDMRVLPPVVVLGDQCQMILQVVGFEKLKPTSPAASVASKKTHGKQKFAVPH